MKIVYELIPNLNKFRYFRSAF